MNLDLILKKITPTNQEFFAKAKEKTSKLIMPPRAMGVLNDISEQLCAIGSTLNPKTDKKAVFVMAADHGVVEEGISAFDSVVTCQMIQAFINDVATINALARQSNCAVIVSDVGTKCNIPQSLGPNKFILRKVKIGTNNFIKEPAMSKTEAIQSILTGFSIASQEIQANQLNLIATGDMGIGNTTAASAIGAVLTKNDPELMTGNGTGIGPQTLAKKIRVIKKAIELLNPDPDDAIDTLSKVGGIEIGAVAGVILAASYHKIPVVIDGLISTAGALVAYKLNPLTKYYMLMGHKSAESGHEKMIEYLGLTPLLHLNMRLGEGTGAVLAMHIIDAAARIIEEVGTFETANVSDSK